MSCWSHQACSGSDIVCMCAEEEAGITRLLYLDPAEPRESFSSDTVICSLISSCLVFKHNYEMKAAKISAFYAFGFLVFIVHHLR